MKTGLVTFHTNSLETDCLLIRCCEISCESSWMCWSRWGAQYSDQHVHDLPLVVVEQDDPSLLGRNWLSRIRLDWPNICSVVQDNVEDILVKYPEMFRCSLGEYRGPSVKLFIDVDAKPLFSKAKTCAIRNRKESKRGHREECAAWHMATGWLFWLAAPLVPIAKSDGWVRLCGDYKITINQVCRVDPYPLPRIEDIFAELRGGKIFSKIDLRSAYSQIPVHEKFQKYLTVSTHLGFFSVSPAMYWEVWMVLVSTLIFW